MSISRFRKRLSQGLLLCLFLPATFLPAQTTRQVTATRHPFLWRIDGKGDKAFDVKSWLLGTMHLGDERLVTLPDPVEKALDAADAVYCELEMDKMQKQQLKLVRKMILPKGQTLRDRLPRELYRRLSDYVTSRGGSMRTLQRMRVWAVYLNLVMMDAVKEGMTKSLDVMLYKDAKAEDKETGGLETLEEQLAALAALSEEDQIKVLVQTLDYMEELVAKGTSSVRKMLEVYLTGDEDRLMAVARESMGNDKELMERLLKPIVADRNVRMADRMAKLMAENAGKSYFFAVGALHCPGKEGIVELLRRKGYRVQRIAAPGKVEKTRSERPASRPLEKVGR